GVDTEPPRRRKLTGRDALFRGSASFLGSHDPYALIAHDARSNSTVWNQMVYHEEGAGPARLGSRIGGEAHIECVRRLLSFFIGSMARRLWRGSAGADHLRGTQLAAPSRTRRPLGAAAPSRLSRHSITWSACNSSVCGIVMPSAFAVLRLTSN